jgi:hypothetical protein
MPSREITADSNLLGFVRESNLHSIISDPPMARSLMTCRILMGWELELGLLRLGLSINAPSGGKTGPERILEAIRCFRNPELLIQQREL